MTRRPALISAREGLRSAFRQWGGRVVLAAALAVLAGITGTASGAVSYGAWVTVDTECELSGGWMARVGYLGPEGEDKPAVVELTGAMVGARFELDYSSPFAAANVSIAGAPPLEEAEAYFSGNWMGDATGEWDQIVNGVTYSLTARYTLGGFNPGGNPDDPPEDSQWGWWEGTFAARLNDCPATVPETETVALFGLAAVVAAGRRRRPH